MPRCALMPFLLFAGLVSLRADGLADLKSSLRAVPIHTTLRLKIEQQEIEHEGKDATETRRVSVVEDGPKGLKILEDSGKSNTVKKNDKAKESEFYSQVRPQVGLLELLDKAKLLEEKADLLDGKPVRLLRLSLDANLDEDTRKHLKKFDQDLRIWVGPDGLPMAMDMRMDIQARAMLVFSVWTKIHLHRVFRVVENRLIEVEEQTEAKGKVMGMAFDSTETIRCIVQA